MKIKSILVFGFCLLVPALLFGQEQEEGKQQNLGSKQLGLSYSTLGGAGIHYILPANARDNVKFVGIIIYREEGSSKESFYSFGIEYQRDLLEEENLRAYLTVGTHVDNRFSNSIYFNNTYDTEKVSFFSLGTGFGIDFGNDLPKGLILNAHVTYQLTQGLGGTDRTRLGLGGGIGIGFNF